MTFKLKRMPEQTSKGNIGKHSSKKAIQRTDKNEVL
jgi:hypothetical protein